MTRMGSKVLDVLRDGEFVPCMHSVGAPLAPGQKDVPWPCNKTEKYITHFPETREIWSYGSGYGGNALLGKEVLRPAHRLHDGARTRTGWPSTCSSWASSRRPARRPTWRRRSRAPVARPTSPCSSRPRRCTAGRCGPWATDIAWLKPVDGVLRAINPEAGYFGVAPGTSFHTNPNAMESISGNTIFTNVALTTTATSGGKG